jgi:hypothetical protein
MFDPFMPNDVRRLPEECVWSEKEKIGVLQAVAWRGEATAAAAANCERLSGPVDQSACDGAAGGRGREGKRVWPR